MTKKGMRAFAAGLWASAVVLACFFYFGQKPQETAAKPSKITPAEVQQYLTSHNQIAVDEKKYESLQTAANTKGQSKQNNSSQKAGNDKKGNKSSGKSAKSGSSSNKKSRSTKQKNQSNQSKSYTLHIQSGMTGGEIGRTLEHKNIISNWYDLSKYLQNHNLENKVQLGTFTVTSDMSVAEIAKKITS